jgi:hypothetical protein
VAAGAVTITARNWTALMPKICRSLYILLMVALYGWTNSAAAETPHRVKVSIVRLESSLHTSVGNRDAYLIRVTPKSGRTFAARMVDEYPSYADTLPGSSVGERASFSVALRRTPYCDDAPERMGASVAGDQSVPCFAVIHGSWRAPKLQAKDEWWK